MTVRLRSQQVNMVVAAVIFDQTTKAVESADAQRLLSTTPHYSE